MSFSSLGLSAELLRAVSEQGYTTPTPVQTQAIPVVLAGGDLMAGAQTGTGKTAAFALPLLQNLQANQAQAQTQAQTKPGRRKVRALILTPTRELAGQVAESITAYSQYLPLRTGLVFGGVGINPQLQMLRKGVDILVATPGRLIDHIERNSVDLSAVEIVVLDEADRMLDMGFIHAIKRIMQKLPRRRQGLLFSATFPDNISKLAQQFLHQPQLIEVAKRNTSSENIVQSAFLVDRGRKRELLSHLIGAENWNQVLVFTRTKRGADRLAKQLNSDGVEATAIHGNKSQNARERALKAFKKQSVQALIATDVAARGIDIDRLPHVVNYDIPDAAEDYVHRIGRTGRAGCEGRAVSLVSADEKRQWSAIERMVSQRIPAQVLTGFEPDHQAGPESHKASSPKRRPGGNTQAKQGNGRPRAQGKPGARNGGKQSRRRAA